MWWDPARFQAGRVSGAVEAPPGQLGDDRFPGHAPSRSRTRTIRVVSPVCIGRFARPSFVQITSTSARTALEILLNPKYPPCLNFTPWGVYLSRAHPRKFPSYSSDVSTCPANWHLPGRLAKVEG